MSPEYVASSCLLTSSHAAPLASPDEKSVLLSPGSQDGTVARGGKVAPAAEGRAG